MGGVLISWCFEPSQPHRVIFMHTFLKSDLQNQSIHTCKTKHPYKHQAEIFEELVLSWELIYTTILINGGVGGWGRVRKCGFKKGWSCIRRSTVMIISNSLKALLMMIAFI